MGRYRTRPAEVDAVRFDGSEASAEAIIGLYPDRVRRGWAQATLYVVTAASTGTISTGDWVVRDERGDVYPVTAYDFEKSYERVP